MNNIADIHCHLLPYVDDGAQDKTESRRLLRQEYEQGVRVICLTPHLRKGMFETPDAEIFEQFARFKERAGAYGKKMRFFLSREYFCDSSFIQNLEAGDVLTYGEGNYVLTEMSSRYTDQQILEYVRMIRQSGYRPLIAHIERYPAVRKSPELIQRLIDMGGKIQINAGSVIGKEGIKQAAFCRKLLKERLVHVVASDAHDSDYRPPYLKQAGSLIESRWGSDYARELFYLNPMRILAAGRKQHGSDQS